MYGPNTELSFSSRCEGKDTSIVAQFPCGRIFVRTRIKTNCGVSAVVERLENFRAYAIAKLRGSNRRDSLPVHLL